MLNALSILCFYLFVFLKPFYLLPSGSIGIADCFLAVSGGFLFCDRVLHSHTRRIGTVTKNLFHDQDRLWFLFVLCVLLINGIYFLLIRKTDLLLHAAYWVYVTLAIRLFRGLAGGDGQDRFLTGLRRVLELNLLVQLVVLLSGRARYFYEGTVGRRLMGSFNDPNQFAFFVFCSLLLLWLCCLRDHRRVETALFAALGLFLIGQSRSTGIFLGVFAFAGIMAILLFYEGYRRSKRRALWLLCGAAALLCFCGFLWMIWPSRDFVLQADNYTLLARIQHKLWKISSGKLEDLLYDRSAERLLLWPRYLLYGAGEGYFERFIPPAEYADRLTPGVFDRFVPNEIHSSFFDVWYAYGIVPLCILCAWIGKQLRCCSRWQLAAVLALFCESFFLMNLRQPLFWWIVVWASTLSPREQAE